MRITESQLRRIVREELMQEMVTYGLDKLEALKTAAPGRLMKIFVDVEEAKPWPRGTIIPATTTLRLLSFDGLHFHHKPWNPPPGVTYGETSGARTPPYVMSGSRQNVPAVRLKVEVLDDVGTLMRGDIAYISILLDELELS